VSSGDFRDRIRRRRLACLWERRLPAFLSFSLAWPFIDDASTWTAPGVLLLVATEEVAAGMVSLLVESMPSMVGYYVWFVCLVTVDGINSCVFEVCDVVSSIRKLSIGWEKNSQVSRAPSYTFYFLFLYLYIDLFFAEKFSLFYFRSSPYGQEGKQAYPGDFSGCTKKNWVGWNPVKSQAMWSTQCWPQ
jgi:hypothetical protein